MIQFITVTFTVVKTHKSKIVHLFYHMEKSAILHFTLESPWFLFQTSYASVYALFTERFILTVCQNWLCRGDIRNTSLISFVNLCLRVGSHSIDRSGLLGLCCHRWHRERRETYTARSQKKPFDTRMTSAIMDRISYPYLQHNRTV